MMKRPERNVPGEGADLVRASGQDRALGTRQVVLGLLGDLREDPAALVVVQVAAMEPARMVGEPAGHRVREGVVGGRGAVEMDAPALAAVDDGDPGADRLHVRADRGRIDPHRGLY